MSGELLLLLAVVYFPAGFVVLKVALSFEKWASKSPELEHEPEDALELVVAILLWPLSVLGSVLRTFGALVWRAWRS